MIKGMDYLSDSNKQMFNKFLNNFMGQFETANIKALEVKEESSYLKFIYLINGEEKWLYVKNENTWY